MRKRFSILLVSLAASVGVIGLASSINLEQRNAVFELGGWYGAKFYDRHPEPEVYSGAFHNFNQETLTIPALALVGEV